MLQLIYVSSAVQEFSKQDLEGLLEQARRNNQAAGITGLLLYKSGNFMQLLEGEPSKVDSIHAKIMQDRRHRGLLTLLRADTTERAFGEWSMGFRDLRTAPSNYPAGYSSFLNSDFRGAEFTANPSNAHKLLLSFRQSM